MFEPSAIHRKLMKQIQKHPNGISTENLANKGKDISVIKYVLDELKQESYVSRLISQDDKIAQTFGLENQEYSGDWVLTDKALSYLQNKKIEWKNNLFNQFMGFIFGIISTLVTQYIISLLNF